MKLLRCCRFVEQILICASFLSISSWCELMGECFSHMFKLKDTRLDSSLSKFVIHRFQSKSPFWIDLHWRRANCLRSIGSGLVGGRTAWKRTRSVSYSAFASILFPLLQIQCLQTFKFPFFHVLLIFFWYSKSQKKALFLHNPCYCEISIIAG